MDNRIFLERYRLSLGRNGLPVELHRTPNGITYRAHAIDSGREVAIELVPATAADEPAQRAEAEAARKVNQINIPTLHDFGVEGDQWVYVTEYFDGHSAEAWVAARGPLSTGASLRVGIQATAAMGAASFHRFHHRALNPANIIFIPGQTAEGDWPAIKVLHWLGPAPDFRATSGDDASRDAAARFASPEQRAGGEVDFASEVFSLGATIWFLLTGAPPAADRRGTEKLRGCPKILRHLLGRMLRLNPAERPQDPMALSAYLQTCLARVERRESLGKKFALPVATRPRAVVARAPRVWPKKALALAALFLVAALLAAIAVPRFLAERRLRQANVRAEEPQVSLGKPEQFSSALALPVSRQIPNQASATNHAIQRDEFAAEPPPPAEGTVEVVDATAPPAASPTGTVEVASAVAPPSPEGTVAALAQFPARPEVASVPVATSVETPAQAAAPDLAVNESLVAPTPVDSPAGTVEVAVATPFPEPMASPERAVELASATAPPSPSPEGSIAAFAQFPARPEVASVPVATPAETPAQAAAPDVAVNESVASPAPVEPARKISRSHTRKKVTAHSSRRVAKSSRKKIRVAHTTRRGKKVPNLHVGSARAELVGTTADGRWILSVASSGRRIIVPPPPGFAP